MSGGSAKGLWGGRFEGGLDPAFASFNQSLGFDRRLWREDVEGSRAWAAALGRAEVLTSEEVAQLDAALAELTTELDADPSPLGTSDAEDIHSFVEAALTVKVGSLAKKLHTGRSRNDQVATDLLLHLRGVWGDMDAALAGLIGALVDLAEANADLALPGYTHLQRAQPVTAGHHALAYAEMLQRDRSRFSDAARRADVSPLGCAALAGVAWPIDREALGKELGFSDVAHNSLDAVSNRDHVLETCFASSLTLVHLSRLCEDWIFFATQEAGYLAMGDDVSTGSSLMPQKKNPDALELIRGKAGRVIGHLQGLLVTVKGLPLAYDKDLQEDKEALFDAVDTTLACLRVMTTVVEGARYDRERCRAASERGFLDATDLADLLVQAGVPFRDAHERVGVAVREALESGVELRELPAARQADLFPELKGDLAEDLSVEAVLARRSATGGTSPERVRAEVARWRSELGR